MRQQGVHLIYPLSHGLPKTGQSLRYRDGDDGDYEVGWWLGRNNANNRVRFIEKEYVAGEVVIIDLATRLMWPKDGTSSLCNNGNKATWNNAVTVPMTANFGGFSDWLLPNINELLSLSKFNVVSPASWPLFINWQTDNYYGYWSSTTRTDITTYAWYARMIHGYAYSLLKTTTTYYRPCRRYK